MNIACDDGSTNVKLAWIENGEIKTHDSITATKYSGIVYGVLKVLSITVLLLATQSFASLQLMFDATT
ncbi:plasmid segregation protein ParM domain-containing protein [Citrobacter sp. Y3]|uniref:plasmid segregation protein ParM domain-containing protein n=1 Tax=Citrobacter sp. Y3 TaxID=2716879 RepID=UPI001F0F1F0B|nr:plasmid segregation protein ParM domain-containing protein [Citrobacter sp. Y3]